jgi:hypothetical protein
LGGRLQQNSIRQMAEPFHDPRTPRFHLRPTSPVTAPGYRGLFHNNPVPSCALTRDDLRKLYRELEPRAREAVVEQLAWLSQPVGMDDAEFQRSKESVISRSGLTVNILGSRGEQVGGTHSGVLDDANLPDRITQISFDSAAAYRAQMNVNPLDRFLIRFDFTEPPNYGKYNPWDENTPNDSLIEVVGAKETWVTAVHENTLAFLRHRSRRRAWLHSSATFNIANYLIGFPLAFWVVFRLDQMFSTPLSRVPGVLKGAIYVYLVLMALLVFRVCFALLRWIFPVVELEGAPTKSARAAVSAFVFALLSSLAYDILKAAVGS